MQRKLNIAMVAACPFSAAQGSQVYIQQMSEALVKRGHRVHLICYHFGEHHQKFNFEINRIPRITSYYRFRAGPSFQKPLLDFMLFLKLWQVVKKEAIDIIHAHNYEAPLAGLLVKRLTGIPVIFNSHNVLSDELYTYFRLKFSKRLAKSLAHYLDTYIPKKADFCITVSQEAVSFFKAKGVAPDRIRFIPPGIDYHNTKACTPRAVREKYDLRAQPLIIYTGNLDGYQNIELLFHSIKRVSKSLAEFTVVMVTNSDYNKYKKLAKEIGIDRYILFFYSLTFNQTQEILAIADIAVSPRTSWSGFPIKLLNYMAAGKAIVASEGSAKGIEHLHNGLVIKNGDSEGFAHAILQLIKDPELVKKLGRNARKTVLHYRWKQITQEIEEVYEKVLHLPHPLKKCPELK